MAQGLLRVASPQDLFAYLMPSLTPDLVRSRLDAESGGPTMKAFMTRMRLNSVQFCSASTMLTTRCS